MIFMRSTVSELQAFANATYGGQMSLLTPYTYRVTFGAIAANATEFQQLQIQANADFILTSLALFVNDDGAAVNQFPFKTLITDNSSGEQFTASAICAGVYLNDCGGFNGTISGNFVVGGVELPYPLFIQGRTSLTCMMQNLSATAYEDVILVLHGVLARKYSTS